ncbi:MAG: prepilin-type N-terminal cleavage/methylation domain-containing protein [Planctomycetota bacterium]
MLPTRTRKAQGFTLVEILIVVVILGILAAIVIPQFTSASENAKASSLTSQLQTIRSQLELYQINHGGDYPDFSSNWDQFTELTNEAGNTSGTPTPTLGPYMQKPPANPFGGLTAVNQVTGTTAVTGTSGTHGWGYNTDTGEIKAILPDTVTATEAQGLGLDIVNDVVVTAS